MTDEGPSLEPWLGALRADVEPMSAAARQRVASRLAATALVVSAAGIAGPAMAGMVRRGFVHSRLFAVALALPAGALVGAAGHAYWPRPATPPAIAMARVTPPPPAAVAAPIPTTPVVAVEARPAAASPAPTAPAGAPSVKSEREAPSLERELSLLERARTSLSEGQPRSTLQLLREHRTAYPSSALSQEREALTIRALIAAGSIAEARGRAARFVEMYPMSALRGSVERAVESIP